MALGPGEPGCKDWAVYAILVHWSPKVKTIIILNTNQLLSFSFVYKLREYTTGNCSSKIFEKIKF